MTNVTLPRARPGALVLVGLLALLAVGCTHHNAIRGSGPLVVEERRLAGDFDGVSLDTSAEALVTIDPDATETFVRVTAQENIIPLIVTEVRRGTLVIRANASFSTRQGVRVEVIAPHVSAARVRGSGGMAVRNIDTGLFLGSTSGSGDLQLQGQAQEVDLRVSGSGSVRAGRLMAQRGEARVAGSGDIALTARESVFARVSGSGDVVCHGSPRQVRRNVTGSGQIRVVQ